MENQNANVQRANKVTTYFAGEGIMVATFYRTHNKLGQIRSDDERVLAGGFVMPVSTEAAPGIEAKEVTPNEKLEAFKAWITANSTLFGFYYDPIDRRSEGSKFPAKYDEAIFTDTAIKVVTETLTNVVTSVQNNTIGSMINQGHVPAGTQIQCSSSAPKVTIQELYKNGNIKYATAEFDIVFTIADKSTTIPVVVKIISGQLQKPRNLGTYVFTAAGLKSALVDATLLPKIEKPKEEVATKGGEVPAEKKSTRKSKTDATQCEATCEATQPATV